jgi:TPR repeat protein
VPLDYVKAYVFYSLAASAGDDRSTHELKSLSKRMTPHQLEQARVQLANLQTPHGPAESAGLLSLPEGK